MVAARAFYCTVCRGHALRVIVIYNQLWKISVKMGMNDSLIKDIRMAFDDRPGIAKGLEELLGIVPIT